MLTQAQYDAATDELASSIEAPLIAAVDANREAILADVGVFWRFIAVRMWSAVLRLVPILARAALAALLDKFAATTIGDIADLLYAHKAIAEARAQKESQP